MSRTKTMLEDVQEDFEDFDYQFNTWKAEKLKEHMTPNEYEIRTLEENQISNFKK